MRGQTTQLPPLISYSFTAGLSSPDALAKESISGGFKGGWSCTIALGLQ